MLAAAAAANGTAVVQQLEVDQVMSESNFLKFAVHWQPEWLSRAPGPQVLLHCDCTSVGYTYSLAARNTRLRPE